MMIFLIHNPIEEVGTSTLEVIPPNGRILHIPIRSDSPNPNITQASVSLLGFDSSVDPNKRD